MDKNTIISPFIDVVPFSPFPLSRIEGRDKLVISAFLPSFSFIRQSFGLLCLPYFPLSQFCFCSVRCHLPPSTLFLNSPPFGLPCLSYFLLSQFCFCLRDASQKRSNKPGEGGEQIDASLMDPHTHIAKVSIQAQIAIFSVFSFMVKNGQMDERTHRRTDPLIQMRGRI